MRLIQTLAAAVATLALVTAASAQQDYPNKAITWVVPFTPAGQADTAARVLAKVAGDKLGQQIIIDNRPGAGGIIGAEIVMNAKPDGYTIFYGSSGPMGILPKLHKNLSYDPVKNFAPIAMVIYAPQMLAVHPSMPVNSLPELVAYAKSNPGKVAFGSSGHGTQPHLLGEMLKLMAGIDLIHVPYRGAGRNVTDVVAGQVQMIFETTAILLPHIQSGKLRALAVAAEARSPLLPGVPTTAENGYPKLTASFWSGVLAPAGTPAAIVDKLNGAINEILRSKEAQDGLARLSAEAKIGSPQDFAAFIASETPRWAAIANETGVKVD